MVSVEYREQSTIRVRVVTHNIRYATEAPFPGEEPWESRRPRLCAELAFLTLKQQAFVCLQEVLHHQLQDVLAALRARSPHWSYIGVGRDDGKEAGEYSPIFYRKDEWTIVSEATFWLSPTPFVPSKGWDAASPRILTTGVFRHNANDQDVEVANTHLDDQGAQSRLEGAKLISTLTTDSPSVPTILCGDFNSTTEDEAYKLISGSSGRYQDSRLRVPETLRYGHKTTFTGFGDEGTLPSLIDFVFFAKDSQSRLTSVESYGVMENKFDGVHYVSDHRAVVVDLGLYTGL